MSRAGRLVNKAGERALSGAIVATLIHFQVFAAVCMTVWVVPISYGREYVDVVNSWSDAAKINEQSSASSKVQRLSNAMAFSNMMGRFFPVVLLAAFVYFPLYWLLQLALFRRLPKAAVPLNSLATISGLLALVSVAVFDVRVGLEVRGEAMRLGVHQGFLDRLFWRL